MEEMLKELLQFLQVNGLDNLITSIIITLIGVIVAIFRTSKKAIQKKVGYVNLNNFRIDDYVIIYKNELLSFDLVTIKAKKDITKIDLSKYKDIGGVFDVTTKNEKKN